MQHRVMKMRRMLVVGFRVFGLSQAALAIGLDASFDHAALDVSNSYYSSHNNTFHLDGRENYFGRWRWLYFKADGVKNLSPKFSITSRFAGGSSKLSKHKMIYSYDQKNWHFFNNNGLKSNGKYEFSNQSPFTSNQVYVAYSFPYSYGRAASHTQSLVGNPCVQPTKSANSNFVIGQSPGGVDDLGRIVTPKNMFGYKITDASSLKPKKKITLISGVHANEVLGTHTFEGMINMLTSNDWRMKQLRQYAEFYVYPMANPDGRFAGNNRAGIANPGKDPNRYWHPNLYNKKGWDDIKVTADAMIKDTDGDVDYHIDFHSTIPTSANEDFAFIPPEDRYNDFWLALKDYEPQLKYRASTGTSWYTTNFAEKFLKAEFDMTFETMFGLNRGLDHYHDMGKNFALAFYKTLVPEDIPEPSTLLLMTVLGGSLLRRKR